METYHEGRIAYLQHLYLDNNPYDEDTEDYEEWDRGFLDAAMEHGGVEYLALQ